MKIFSHLLKRSSGHLHTHNPPARHPAIISLTEPMQANSSANPYASAVQPGRKHLPLAELNPASVRIGGTWDIFVSRSFEDTYNYTWQGKPRQGSNFVCILVCAEDPRQYCQAQFKKTNQNVAKYAQAQKTFKNEMRFVMSKVGFVDDAKAAYVSTPLKIVVDLSRTKMDPFLGASNSAVQPAPTATVASSIDLGTNQFFDVTALVQDVGETGSYDNNRSSFLVNIMDGSLDKSTGKVKIMPLRVFFDTVVKSTPASTASQSGDQLTALIKEQLQNKAAVSFFCISGGQDAQGKFAFRTTRNTFLSKAAGPKAEKLNNNAELHSMKVEDTVAFELQTSRAARDWAQEKGRETCCKLLSSFARTATGIAELDNGETIWQLNWLQITEPSETESLKSKAGTHLWFRLAMCDHSGPIVLYITEQAAIKLAHVVDAAEFVQMHSENRLRFPFWASVKVWRKPSKTSAAEPGSSQFSAAQPDRNNGFDCFIVDAEEQDMQQGPSLRSTMLLPMLGDSVDSVLPTTLDMIRKSEHYALAVEYITQQVPPELLKTASKTVAGVSMLRPCSKGVALIMSSKRSKVLEAGAGGHKLVTDGVVDYLSPGSDATKKKYTLTSFCTLDTVTDFKLDPPSRSKSQAALITFTSVLEADSGEQPVTSLLVDNVQLLPPNEAEAFKPVLSKMIYFAALAGQVSRKRECESWTPEANPAKALTCRLLGRSPTGPALPDYTHSP